MRSDEVPKCEAQQIQGWYGWNEPLPDRSTWASEYLAGSLFDKVYEVSRLKDRPAQGLVVCLGSTDSGKSTLVRGLVDHYLMDCRKRAKPPPSNHAGKVSRRPHLVAIEDPVERRYALAADEDWSPGETATKLGVDCTSRTLKVDTPDLENALRDAKRQRPDVVFVGEVRTRDDWKQIIDFAGSGHLIVTTSHAGSLIEAMSTILRASEAETAPEKAFIAGRILAMVHQRKYKAEGTGASHYIPCVWRRTPASMAAFVMDGLASLLPHCPDDDWCQGCIGRQAFAELIDDCPGREKIVRQALADDLQGL